jgi:hypothetical protein
MVMIIIIFIVIIMIIINTTTTTTHLWMAVIDMQIRGRGVRDLFPFTQQAHEVARLAHQRVLPLHNGEAQRTCTVAVSGMLGELLHYSLTMCCPVRKGAYRSRDVMEPHIRLSKTPRHTEG